MLKPLVMGVFIAPGVAFLLQFIGIQGQLSCGKVPLPSTSVMLWRRTLLGSGYELSQSFTDRDGAFRIEGNDSSLLPLNVRLKIVHHCDAASPCRRILDLPVPPNYVTRGFSVLKWFKAGHLNMAYRFPGEVRRCDNATV